LAPEGVEIASINATWPPSGAFYIGAKIYLLIVDFCSNKITNYFSFYIFNIYHSCLYKIVSYFIGAKIYD